MLGALSKCPLVVFRMSSNSHDQDNLGLVRDFDVQSVAVSFQIEDDSVVRQEAGRREPRFDVVWRVPLGVLNFR